MTYRSLLFLICIGALLMPTGCSSNRELRALPGDASRLVRQEAKSCDLGNMLGCHNLAIAWHFGEGIGEADPERARALFERACEGGSDASCRMLAQILADSNELDAADELLARQCELGEYTACLRWAQHRIDAGDVSAALHRLAADCQQGVTISCAELGITLVRHGDGSEASREQGLTLLRDACNDGLTRGCRLQAEAIIESTATDAELPADVATLLGRSCLDTDPVACLRLAELHERGRVAEPDPDYAATLRARACAYGLQEACNEEP